ncbi:ImcF-like protein [Terasakiispira papahanaumokuakeensis]|uniref:ImcF-like protein n=2 Tax=Terasakiispira papahanaumokuakeensis TaxID=197479 RepID=A0A1E2VEX9_9GAMM|nr:ImcF-like protein [Terasakiispira papahanaumokuakeensis]
MKRMLKALTRFWPAAILLWLTGLALCVLVLPLWVAERETLFQCMALWTAFWMLVVVLRLYYRIRAERSIENLVELEVQRDGAEQAGDYQVLRERLKHAIAMQRAALGDSRSGASLYELPWYLVMGLSAAGKTSLLSRSGMTNGMAGQADAAAMSGTRHCDWYFGREAVMIDTAGRYLVEDQPAAEFADFLKTLRRKRRKPAINGLVLVVSLPELLRESRQEAQHLADQLALRMQSYRECLGVNPPVYLFFSKVDLLPGFADTFSSLDAEARQTPWGMTFARDEIRQQGVHDSFNQHFQTLVSQLHHHVDQALEAQGVEASSALLRFPDYFAELAGVLSDFLRRFDQRVHPEDAPMLRGLYFTSALQEGSPLPALFDEQCRQSFALSPQTSLSASTGPLASAPLAGGTAAEPLSADGLSHTGSFSTSRDYFIRDVFTQVILPDRNLSRQNLLQRWSPTLTAGGAGLLLLMVGLQASSTWHNRQWQQEISHSLATMQVPGDLTDEQQLRLLQQWPVLLEQQETFQSEGVPITWGMGLYQGQSVGPTLKQAWATMMREQALAPMLSHLKQRLQAVNAFTARLNVPERRDESATDLEMTDEQRHKVKQAADEARQQAQSIAEKAAQQMQEQATQGPTFSRPRSLSDVRSSVRNDLEERTVDNARQAWWSTRSDARNEMHQRLDRVGEGQSTPQAPTLGLGDDPRFSGESGQRQGPVVSDSLMTQLTSAQVARLIEGYSSLKLYLILTEPEAHPDQAPFVAEVMPRLLQQLSLESSDGGLSVGALKDWDEATIQANSQLYAHYLAQKTAPEMPQDEFLVAQSRKSLNAFLMDSSLVDRTYLQYQLAVEQRYRPLTLADMAPDTPNQLLYAGRSVPAFYTRQVWEDYVRPAILETVSGDLEQQSDWVLDDEAMQTAVQSKARFVRQLMKRYKHDYAVAWERFLGSVHVADFDTLKQASGGLAPLGDVQASPLRQLLEAVDQNTRWDQRLSEKADEAAGGDQGFWTRVTGAFEAESESAGVALSDLPRINDGALTAHFRPVRRLLENEGESQTAEGSLLNHYLLDLRQLKARIDNIQSARNPGRRSKQLIASTLVGDKTEFTTLRDFVAAQVDISRSSLVASLKPLFERPVENTWQALNGPARHQLNQAWDAQVHDPWEDMIAGRYPVADSVNEASVRDMRHFIDPDAGVLAKFRKDELGALVDGQEGARSALVDPRMLRSMDKADALGRVIESLSDLRNGFEVRMVPTPGVTDILLTIDGQTLHYRNNRQVWERMVWPGEQEKAGARLDIVTRTGRRHTVFDYPNRWGLLRMIYSARITPLDRARQRFSWETFAGEISFEVRNFGGVSMTDLKQIRSLDMPRLVR